MPIDMNNGNNIILELAVTVFSNVYVHNIIKQLVNCPSRMMGKSKTEKKHSHKYYPIRPKIPQQQMINQPINTCLLYR
jgi:hypothetical protein